MYLEHWKIERSPFAVGLDVENFYASPVHEEALARIEFLAGANRRLGVLLGAEGLGKSLTLRVAQHQLIRQGMAVVVVDALGTSSREFFWQVAEGLGTAPVAEDDLGRLWRRIARKVDEHRTLGIETVLLVDDAGQAGPDLVTQLVRLTQLDPAAHARWTMVLAAVPQQAAHWNQSLRELIDLRIDLAPWDEVDTVGYLQSSLIDAGRIEPVFDYDALRTLHALSGGVPRRVARLADLAMLAAAATELERVDADTVGGAAAEIERTISLAI